MKAFPLSILQKGTKKRRHRSSSSSSASRAADRKEPGRKEEKKAKRRTPKEYHDPPSVYSPKFKKHIDNIVKAMNGVTPLKQRPQDPQFNPADVMQVCADYIYPALRDYSVAIGASGGRLRMPRRTTVQDVSREVR